METKRTMPIYIGIGEVVEEWWEEITPERAADLLSRNSANRPIIGRALLRYKDDLVNGAFTVTHQGIAINEDGCLIDGQHRLTAIIETGIPLWFRVTKEKGHTTALGRNYDQGKPRKPQTINGICERSAQVINFIHGSLFWNGNPTASRQLAFYNKLEKYFKRLELNDVTRRENTSATAIRAAVFVADVGGIDWYSKYRLLQTRKEELLDTDLAILKRRLAENKAFGTTQQRVRAFSLTMATILDPEIRAYSSKQLGKAYDLAKDIIGKYI